MTLTIDTIISGFLGFAFILLVMKLAKPIWWNPRANERRWLIFLLVVNALWVLVNTIQAFTQHEVLHQVLYDLEWASIVMIPPAFLMLVFEINRFQKYIGFAAWGFLLAMPVSILFARYAISPDKSYLGQFVVNGFKNFHPETLWLFYLGYMVSLVVFGCYYLLRLAWMRNKEIMKDGQPMIIAISLTLIVIVIDQSGILSGILPQELTDFAISGFVLFLAIMIDRVQEADLKRYQELNLVPAVSTPVFLSPSFQPKMSLHQKKSPVQRQVILEEDTGNPLVRALNRITAQSSTYVDTEGVLTVMGEELKRLGILFAFCTLSEDQEKLSVNYASILPAVRKRVEKIFGAQLSGLSFSVESWRELQEVLEKKGEGIFNKTIAEESRGVLAHLPDGIINVIFNMVGITENTASAAIAETLQNGSNVIICFWGNNFRSSDLPMFSQFAAQMVEVYNRALQYEINRDHASELERSNLLIQALGNVTARASTAVGTDAVLEAFDVELRNLGFQYLLMFTNQDQSRIELKKITIDKWAMPIIGKRVFELVREIVSEPENWPGPVKLSISELKPYYTRDLMEFLPEAIYQQRKTLIDLAFRQINYNDSTAAIVIPQEMADQRIALFAVVGDDLHPTDIPTFQVFAGQATSAITKELLHEAGKQRSKDLVRSNAMIEALNLVSTVVSYSTDLDVIMQSLGDELKKLELDCMIMLTGEEDQEGYIRYHSMNSNLIRRAEQFTGTRITEQAIHFDRWPETLGKVIGDQKAVYVYSFFDLLMQFMATHLPKPILTNMLKMVNITDDTRGFFLPLVVNEDAFGILIVWGNTITQEDLSGFSIFTKQISIAFENAQMLHTQIQQAAQLKHSNHLLETLGQLSFPIASSLEPQPIGETIKKEFLLMGLDFVYMEVDNKERKVFLRQFSLSDQLMDFVKTATKLLSGENHMFKLRKELKDSSRSIISNEIFYIDNFLQYTQERIPGHSRRLIARILSLANITETTTAIMVPIRREAGNADILVVWGTDLPEEDVNAFRIFKQQAESIIEINRLYSLAEHEIEVRRIIQHEYQGLFENAHDAIVLSDFTTHEVIQANGRALEMFGYSREEFLTLRLDELTENIEKLTQVILSIQNDHLPRHFDLLQFRRNDPEPMYMEINASVVTYFGKPTLQSIHRDVTERKHMEEKLRHDSLHDALTGLPNRTLLLDRLEHVIARSVRNNDFSFCVLYFDLDRFKDVNDSLGHMAGDQLLRIIADELYKNVRETDTVARMGGDEFAILMEDLHRLSAIQEYCQRILEIINHPVEIMDVEVLVSGSIGVAIGKPHLTSAEEYLRDADIALYRAKAEGRNRFSIFDVSMRQAIMKRVEIEGNLRKAIEYDEFFLTYQPVIDLQQDELVGFEALLRWRNHGKLISPSEFIPIAEDIRFINQIGYWVLETACKQIQQWQNVYVQAKALKININISPVQLMRPEFPGEVMALLEAYSISAQQIAFEITETAFIADQLAASEQIDLLKEMGIQIYLDDYGTGYSSLSLLNLLKVDALKIDREFIMNLDENNQKELVRTIIALGKNVGLRVVAEGVISESHSVFLREIGCGFAQGYHFDRPLTAHDATRKVVECCEKKLAEENS